jgi:alcohol dehydrogenase, propanol-preferring
MKAMVLERIVELRQNAMPLKLVDRPDPSPGFSEILVRVSVCGICHTELDEIEGRTPPPRLPIIPGHQVVGRVAAAGAGVKKHKIGDRVGIGWIFSADETCRFCRRGNENLCDGFRATGRDADGGYAQYIRVSEDFAYAIPGLFSDAEAAPLLCAGAIGYRSLRLTGMENGDVLGLIGFGASAHLVIQIARYRFPSSRILVFARTEGERNFARELGAYWAGNMGDQPPEKPNRAIDTTPAWKPILEGLTALEKGGRLVVNAIRKEAVDRDLLRTLDYSRQLWLEKEIKSVANVTRQDITEFLEVAAQIPIKPEVEEFPLEEANRALLDLKNKKVRGAKVLRIE